MLGGGERRCGEGKQRARSAIPHAVQIGHAGSCDLVGLRRQDGAVERHTGVDN